MPIETMEELERAMGLAKQLAKFHFSYQTVDPAIPTTDGATMSTRPSARSIVEAALKQLGKHKPGRPKIPGSWPGPQCGVPRSTWYRRRKAR
jgi:hypothetical protein